MSRVALGWPTTARPGKVGRRSRTARPCRTRWRPRWPASAACRARCPPSARVAPTPACTAPCRSCTWTRRWTGAWSPVRGVNAFLPPSISVQWARQVPDDFHARSRPVRAPTSICCGAAACVPRCGPGAPAGASSRWTWPPCARPAPCWASTISPASVRRSARPSIRCATCIAWTSRNAARFCFTLRANAFLHHMVRNIMRAAAGRAGQGTGGMDGAAAVLARPQARRADLRA